MSIFALALHRGKYYLPARINIVFLILSLCQTCSCLLRAFCYRLRYTDSERHNAVASSGGRLCLTISTILRKVEKHKFAKFMVINDYICVFKYIIIRHIEA